MYKYFWKEKSFAQKKGPNVKNRRAVVGSRLIPFTHKLQTKYHFREFQKQKLIWLLIKLAQKS